MHPASLAQRIEHQPSKLSVIGSNPIRCKHRISDRVVEGVGFENRSIEKYRGFESHLILIKKIKPIVQRLERAAHNGKVAGSNPARLRLRSPHPVL